MNKYLKYFAFIIFIFFYEICTMKILIKKNTSSVKYNFDKVDVDDDLKSEIEQTKTPENGFSPYIHIFDQVFTIIPLKIVSQLLLLKKLIWYFIRDIYSEEIRNEYIRSNSTFIIRSSLWLL